MQLFNSRTGKLQTFTPLQDKMVKMYVCGITPYDTTHLGHAFTYVFFDVLQRYLKFRGYQVNYVQNVTDIDDDILRKAKEVGQDWKQLGDFWTNRFLEDMESLNVESPKIVKATDSIEQMIKIIKRLVDLGYAYESQGCIFFEVQKFSRYGKLSGYNQQQMMLLSRERGGNPDDAAKRHPLDFLLWQRSLGDGPAWPFDWFDYAHHKSAQGKGSGRPGWHIECSAMIDQYLGDPPAGGRTIDIHGGGRDLIFPHHESEIAQSESYAGKRPFANFFLHTAMLLYQGEKMSKSLGNLVMVSDLSKKYSSNSLRWLLLSHHYRNPWEFSEDELKKSQKRVCQIEEILRDSGTGEKVSSGTYLDQFCQVMDRDISTPLVLELLEKMAKLIKQEKAQSKANQQKTQLKYLYQTLGFRAI